MALDTTTKKGKKRLRVIECKKSEHTNKDESKNYYLYTEDHEDLKTKWSLPNSGSISNGGWSGDGVKRYSLFRKHNLQARSTPEGRKWEQDALALLRAENNIAEANHELQQKKSGGRSSGSGGGDKVLDNKVLFGDLKENEELEELVEEV